MLSCPECKKNYSDSECVKEIHDDDVYSYCPVCRSMLLDEAEVAQALNDLSFMKEKEKEQDVVYIDIDLIHLAHKYLEMKARKTRQEYDIADLFDACHEILKRSEKQNRYTKGAMRFRFVDGHLEVYAKDLREALCL